MSVSSASPVDDLAEPEFPDSSAAEGPPHSTLLRLHIVAILLLALPLFGQSFHYVKDLLPLWALSKAFPVLSLPLALFILKQPVLPAARQTLLTFTWLLLAPTLAGVFYFNQDFFTGIAAQVKLLPILYFFSFSGLLVVLRPSLRELAAAFLVLGITTFILLILFWAFVPDAWYSGTYVIGTSPLFSADSRGHRIRMPMYFGMIFFFYAYRRFLTRPNLTWLFLAGISFWLTLSVVKTRAMIVGMASVLVVNTFFAFGLWGRLMMMIVAPIALTALFSIDYLSSIFNFSASSGINVRLETASKALSFLGISPLRWLLGVGTLSPTNDESLFTYFNHMFFLADISWLGIVFEYGILGAVLLLLYQLRGLAFYFRVRHVTDGVFLSALFDYLLYALMISYLYPLTLSPGETALILAIFVYAERTWQAEPLAEDE